MAQHARYTTFRDGELDAQLRALGGPLGSPGAAPGTSLASSSLASHGRGSRLHKAHACSVRFPDGTEGTCQYERSGPAWHQFRYERPAPKGAELLPKQFWSKPLGNDPAAIEAKAQELAGAAFDEAIQREQREYFMRASEGPGRRKSPALLAMTAAKAKRLAGHYALCRRLGTALVPLGPTFGTLEEACAAWRMQNDPALRIACCNRLDRCWQLPRFNPLHGDPAYCQEDRGKKADQVNLTKGE